MYRCEICSAQSRPGQAQLRHTVYHPSGQIIREYAVCSVCFEELKTEYLEYLIAAHRPEPQPTLPLVNQKVSTTRPAAERVTL
jgi:hypothetical protein